MKADKIKKCFQCGKTFGCTNTEPDGKCWCENIPPVFSINEGEDCFCPKCLQEKYENIVKNKGDKLD